MKFFDRENEMARLREIRERAAESARFTVVPGRHEVKLPFKARVVNLKDGSETVGDRLLLDLTAGETCWFRLYRSSVL